jgi:hypothetical protein
VFLLPLTLTCAAAFITKPCDGGAIRDFEVKIALELVRESSARRDGALGAIVDGAIVELLVVNPRETLEWLKRSGGVADRLLENWSHSVFTDYAGTRAAELRELRRRVICVLESYSTTDPTIMRLRERLLTSAKEIKVSSID